MTAETVVAEQPAATRDDLLEFKVELQNNLQESEDRLHRELQHYATKADLKDTELRLGTEISGLKADLKDTELRLGTEISSLRTDLKDTELRLKTEIGNLRTEFANLRTEFSDLRTEVKVEIRDAQMWLLLRLGGLIVAAVTIAVAVLKLLEGAG